jgi:hypothetical protein
LLREIEVPGMIEIIEVEEMMEEKDKKGVVLTETYI